MEKQYTKKQYSRVFNRIDNAGDGNCLFYAVEMLDDRFNHKELRSLVCDYWKKMEKYYNTVESGKELKESQKHYKYTHDKYELIKLSDDFYDDDGKNHKETICKNLVYGSDTDIFLLAEILRRPIIMYSYNENTKKYVQYDAKTPGFFFKKNTINSDSTHNTPIYLDFNGSNHFQALIPIEKSTSSKKSSPKTRKSSKKSSPSSNTRKLSPKKPSPKKSSPKTRKPSKKSSSKSKTRKSSPNEMKKYEELYGSNPDEYEEAMIQSLLESTKPIGKKKIR